jgi:hypothetical protein
MSDHLDGRIYPYKECMYSDPRKFKVCTETPDDNCPKYRTWIENRNKKQYPDKMCPSFKTCFLSAFLGDYASSSVDCTGTYAKYTERCMEDEDEEEVSDD